MVFFRLALLALALSAAGCAVSHDRCAPRAATLVPSTMPPPPLVDVVTAAPAPGMTLVAGYWHWDALRWVWVPSHWVTPPPGQRWAPARVVRTDGEVRYQPGEMTCAAGNREDGDE